jgi:predicted XRE-type DNA-binding protein
VFKDLGFSAEEAEHLKIRSRMMAHLREVITNRRLTQADAAALFGVSQPRVSDLVRGKIELFSIDTLVDMLNHAGIKVKFTLSEKSRSRAA